jgi:hypothetical protein
MSANLDFAELPGMEATYTAPPPSGESDWAEVAPGQFVVGEETDLPVYTIAKVVTGQDGEFALEPAGDQLGYVRLTETMTIAKALKIEGLSYTTMRRLCYAGFVDYIQIAPHTMLVSIDSLMMHIDATKNSRDEEGGFWTSEKLDAWRESYVW